MVFNTACYSFVPVATGVAPPQGEYVRVRLSAAGSAEHTGTLGPRVEWAEGTIAELRADGSLVLGVVQVRLLDGIDKFWSGSSSVTLLPAQVTEVQRKTLDKGRSRSAGLGFGALLVGIFAIAIRTGGAHGAPTDGGTQPPP